MNHSRFGTSAQRPMPSGNVFRLPSDRAGARRSPWRAGHHRRCDYGWADARIRRHALGAL